MHYYILHHTSDYKARIWSIVVTLYEIEVPLPIHPQVCIHYLVLLYEYSHQASVCNHQASNLTDTGKH